MYLYIVTIKFVGISTLYIMLDVKHLAMIPTSKLIYEDHLNR